MVWVRESLDKRSAIVCRLNCDFTNRRGKATKQTIGSAIPDTIAVVVKKFEGLPAVSDFHRAAPGHSFSIVWPLRIAPSDSRPAM